MSFAWPNFTMPIVLSDGRSFTATFDSYDQRNEVCYYRVTRRSGAGLPSFLAQVGTEWAGDDWEGPEFALRLLDELRSVVLVAANREPGG